MKKFYSLISALAIGVGAMCAQDSAINFTFTTPGDMDGWSIVTSGASGDVADGHLSVQMALQSNSKYRADLQWGANNNANPIVLGDDVQYLAIKFIGTRPHGNMSLEVANGSTTCAYNNTPTGSVTTVGGNTIYYYQLDKSDKYVTPYEARRIQFKIADCVQEPYSYSVDWIKSFATLDDVKATIGLSDDGDTDADEAGAVYNQTTKVNYGSLVEAWKAAASGDVLSLNKDVTVTERLNSNSREITILGNGHTISRAASYNGTLLLTSYAKDSDGKNIPHAGPVTLENLTIDGANISVTGQAIEAGNGGRVVMTDALVQNCITTGSQGVICVKSNGGVTANNLSIKDCTVPEGSGDMFAGSSTIELSGACSFSLFLEGSIYAKDMGVNGGAVTIMFDSAKRNLDAQVITGTNNSTYFPCGVSGYVLVGKNGNLYIQEAIQDGIDAVEVCNDGVLSVYNLQGMPVPCDDINALPAGLYIVNGKKFLVK